MARHKERERETVQGETRELLLQAAADEFAREGYVGANINRISKDAGFAKGTIYNYFSSKRALMLALIDEISTSHLEYVVEEVQQEEDPRHRLERFFEAGFVWVSNHLAQARVEINTIYGPDAEFKSHLYQAYQPMFRLVSREIIAPGIDQDLFRQVNPDATAALLMTIYLGTASQMDDQGRIWLEPRQVAEFAWHALRKNQSRDEGE